jgi:hypothetical protein
MFALASALRSKRKPLLRIRQWVKQGLLRSVQMPGCVRIDEDHILAFIESREGGRRPPDAALNRDVPSLLRSVVT